MNYELRLPLNNILGFLEQSSYGNSLTQEQKDNVYYIQKNSQHLLQLLNKNFYFSKLISGKISIQRNMVILENLVNSISRQFEEEVKRKKLKLNYYIEPEISRYIKIDETKLRTILVNLLDNSIKFTDQGMITIKLFCDNQAWLSDNNTDSLDQENLWIEIEDNGSGIAPDIQDKVFEPFFRVNKKQGFGLGLSITSQLINLMGGKIYLSSQLGRGTIIQFYLPFTIPKTEEIRTNNQHQTIVSLANNEPNYRILVIDDQQENRE
ncbi:sensor histidine kinase, partial [Crocosphaera watsonii]|uniref:sensor histidine kinase n=1 Tax=Crocosphaera watsonii TaxID=263511 RepID=UPI000039CEEB